MRTFAIVVGVLQGVAAVCMGVWGLFWLFVRGRDVSRRVCYVAFALLFLCGGWVVSSARQLWEMT